MFCPKCGTETPDDSQFCRTDLNSGTPTISSRTKTQFKAETDTVIPARSAYRSADFLLQCEGQNESQLQR